MTSLTELMSAEAVEGLATPSNCRLGHEIVAAGGVEFVEAGSQRVTAKAGVEQRRTVVLEVARGRMSWSCTCTSDPEMFCKHMVATAVTLAARR